MLVIPGALRSLWLTLVRRTFPTPFVRWPADYHWVTTYESTDTSGGTRHYVSNGVGTLHSNPQPTGSELMPSTLGNWDPRGDGYVLVHVAWNASSYGIYSELFPDQDPIQTCSYVDSGAGLPAFAPFTKSDWSILAATTTEDFRASANDHVARPTTSPMTGAAPSGASETGMNGTPDSAGVPNGPSPTATSSPTAASSAGCWNQVRINSHYQATFLFGFVICWNIWRL